MSNSLTTFTLASFPDIITSVDFSRSCRSTVRYGARSICEYCFAAPTRLEMRVTESSISLISDSVSIV